MHEGGGDMGMGDMGMGGWMWAMGIPVVLLVLAATALAVAATVWLVRRGRRGDSGTDLLDRRYAAGEIDREEYLARRRDLTGR